LIVASTYNFFKIEWIGGSWYLMHLPATIGRCPAYFLGKLQA